MVNSVTFSTGYSAAAPTEFQAFRTRVGYAADGTKTGVICCHSANGTAKKSAMWGNTGSISLAYPQVQSWLADCGWPVVTPDLGGDPFTNATGSARVGEARTWLQASPQGAKSGKVILLGWSEGGGIALKYALDNPGNVAALVLLQPLSDVADVVTNNRGGFGSLVNSAYSGGYSNATYGATGNPVLFASSLAGIPTWIAYATDDTVILPSTVQTVATGIGASATVGFTSTGGHGEFFLQKLIAADGSCSMIANWLNGLGL